MVNYAAMYAGPEIVYDQAWYLDFGASSHITIDNSNLMRKAPNSGGEQIFIGNGKGLPIKDIGYSCVQSTLNPNFKLHLQNLLYVPQMTKNLVSVWSLS